jgi:hypothetical protein
MPEARKIARYSAEALLVLIPLAIVIYFLVFPDSFDTVLNWLTGHH